MKLFLFEVHIVGALFDICASAYLFLLMNGQKDMASSMALDAAKSMTERSIANNSSTGIPAYGEN